MKKSKKWIWISVVALILVAAIIVGIVLISKGNQEPVYVYGFMDGIAGMSDYYNGSSESYGMVTADRIQPVYLSHTQTVTQVMVSEGQEVKKGDVLFTYDTTLSELELRKKDLSIQQMKLDLEAAEEQLWVINSYVPIYYHPVEPTEPPAAPEEPEMGDLAGKDYAIYKGDGKTALTPKYCWLRSTAMVDDTIRDALFANMLTDYVYVVFQKTQNDTADSEVLEEYGVVFMRFLEGQPEPILPALPGTEQTQPEPTVASAAPVNETQPAASEPTQPPVSEPTQPPAAEPVYVYKMGFYDPNAVDTLLPGIPEDDGVDWNSGYTAAEIASMREAQEERIKTMEFDIKVAESEYKIMLKEADDGQVTAEFDGVVINLLDPETAAATGEALLRVSGGGGYYVSGSVSELERDSLTVGQEVQVMSWDTGMSYTGTIQEIGDYPSEEENYYYPYGSNLSYYPYQVFIEETADLRDGYYVSMMLGSSGEEESQLYINNAFVLDEDGDKYVYVRNSQGILEKRKIRTGTQLWGQYAQILDGLTAEDYVAFPYGRDVRPGAPTAEGTWETLYGY